MERRRERLFSRIKSPETNPAEAECTYHRSSPAPMQSSACEARQEFINHQIRREWFPPRNHGGGACGLRQKCGAGPLPPHRRRPVCSGRNNALAGGCQNADASVGFYGDAELDLKREHPRRNDSCLEAPARGISGNWGHYRDTVGQSVALLLVARLVPNADCQERQFHPSNVVCGGQWFPWRGCRACCRWSRPSRSDVRAPGACSRHPTDEGTSVEPDAVAGCAVATADRQPEPRGRKAIYRCREAGLQHGSWRHRWKKRAEAMLPPLIQIRACRGSGRPRTARAEQAPC